MEAAPRGRCREKGWQGWGETNSQRSRGEKAQPWGEGGVGKGSWPVLVPVPIPHFLPSSIFPCLWLKSASVSRGEWCQLLASWPP